MWDDFRFEDFKDFQFLDAKDVGDDLVTLRLESTLPANVKLQWVPVYRFKILENRTGKKAGYISFRAGNLQQIIDYDGHIGYEIYTHYRGYRYAERACRLLLPLIRRHGFTEVYLTCNPSNIASRKTIEGLGATFLESRYFPQLTQGQDREKYRYKLALTPSR